MPTVSSPPGLLFTCQVTIELVPPERDAKNCCSVTTFTETVAGEMVMLMLATGSVHVELEVVLVAVEVLLVQVIAVLTGAAPQEVSASTAISAATGAMAASSRADSDAGETAGKAKACLALEGTARRAARVHSGPDFKFEISNLKFQTQKDAPYGAPSPERRDLPADAANYARNFIFNATRSEAQNSLFDLRPSPREILRSSQNDARFLQKAAKAEELKSNLENPNSKSQT